jgi:hypothetical protein
LYRRHNSVAPAKFEPARDKFGQVGSRSFLNAVDEVLQLGVAPGELLEVKLAALEELGFTDYADQLPKKYGAFPVRDSVK